MQETIDRASPDGRNESSQEQLERLSQTRIEALEDAQAAVAGLLDTTRENLDVLSQDFDNVIKGVKLLDDLEAGELKRRIGDEVYDSLLEDPSGKTKLDSLQALLKHTVRELYRGANEVEEMVARYTVADNRTRYLHEKIREESCEETDWAL